MEQLGLGTLFVDWCCKNLDVPSQASLSSWKTPVLGVHLKKNEHQWLAIVYTVLCLSVYKLTHQIETNSPDSPTQGPFGLDIRDLQVDLMNLQMIHL